MAVNVQEGVMLSADERGYRAERLLEGGAWKAVGPMERIMPILDMYGTGQHIKPNDKNND